MINFVFNKNKYFNFAKENRQNVFNSCIRFRLNENGFLSLQDSRKSIFNCSFK